MSPEPAPAVKQGGLSVPQRVGQRVREARKAAGMTQAELGEEIGVTGAAIAHLEAGTRDTTVTRLTAIAQVLDLGGLFRELGLDPDMVADPPVTGVSAA